MQSYSVCPLCLHLASIWQHFPSSIFARPDKSNPRHLSRQVSTHPPLSNLSNPHPPNTPTLSYPPCPTPSSSLHLMTYLRLCTPHNPIGSPNTAPREGGLKGGRHPSRWHYRFAGKKPSHGRGRGLRSVWKGAGLRESTASYWRSAPGFLARRNEEVRRGYISVCIHTSCIYIYTCMF